MTLDNNLNLWVSSFSSEEIDEISGSTHQGIQRVFVSGYHTEGITGLNGQTLWNLVFDGNHFIWASDIDGNKVFKVYPEG